jgi:hypothetical protein
MSRFPASVARTALLLALVGATFAAPQTALAHQPRLAGDATTTVEHPEISKAYYGKLTGDPHSFFIYASSSFPLYVNVLVPDVPGQKSDVSAAVIKNNNTINPLVVLDGNKGPWKPFYEPFGADSYLMGPEYRADAGPGVYQIIVWSSNNDSTYSLAIGEAESFDLNETINAIQLIPRIKQEFFHESPATFAQSIFGGIYIALLLGVGFLIGYILRRMLGSAPAALRKGTSSTSNITRLGRLLRTLAGCALLAWAITTSWNPILLLLAGFAFHAAFFGWCLVYRLFGRIRGL